ncbi:metallophosphoesterase [Neomoorella mulderi]|uniref:3',5'-cyclic adenosine monophosphate phosphodiesterase CpdA n=1 Tax=Moorella mulderi DSM 14980 TaxID=1122241 RepID=A0A151AZK5_9FIRM|nr:metallophosphoesterase [Moorella mulderi]KYH33089.1 3',5'-cyclic adenosine monophosphate phosphodiesterase CpdA [Moorella mulderi DSM 14980]
MCENVIHRLLQRRVMKPVIPGLLLFLLLGLVARSSSMVRVEVPLQELPAELDGLTIVHISDLHYGSGRFRSEDSVVQITRLISSLHRDLIVFTGDLLDRSADPALADPCHCKGLRHPWVCTPSRAITTTTSAKK